MLQMLNHLAKPINQVNQKSTKTFFNTLFYTVLPLKTLIPSSRPKFYQINAFIQSQLDPTPPVVAGVPCPPNPLPCPPPRLVMPFRQFSTMTFLNSKCSFLILLYLSIMPYCSNNVAFFSYSYLRRSIMISLSCMIQKRYSSYFYDDYYNRFQTWAQRLTSSAIFYQQAWFSCCCLAAKLKISYWFYFYFLLICAVFSYNSRTILAESSAKSSTSFLYIYVMSTNPALWCRPKSSSSQYFYYLRSLSSLAIFQWFFLRDQWASSSQQQIFQNQRYYSLSQWNFQFIKEDQAAASFYEAYLKAKSMNQSRLTTYATKSISRFFSFSVMSNMAFKNSSFLLLFSAKSIINLYTAKNLSSN